MVLKRVFKMNSDISLNNYKNMLSVSEYLFQGSNIRIQGTNSDPLFHCLDVTKTLGVSQANHNEFYRRNKTNTAYIISVVINHGHKPERFFTETGLYECLFASDSAIAKLFRREVIPLISKMKE